MPRKYAARSLSRRKSSTADLTDAEASVAQYCNPRTVADLGVETLAGSECFVLFDERKQVERHLIISRSVDELKVVAAPGDVAQTIVNDSRHDVNVFLEHRGRIDSERGAGIIARQRLNGVKIKRVHNLWFICHKVMDSICSVKRHLNYFYFDNSFILSSIILKHNCIISSSSPN